MCFSSSKKEEDEILVPVRLVNPTIIKTAPTFPIATVSANHDRTIVLTQRSPRSSQQSYRVERRSTSRSPHTSDRQIVRVETTRSSQHSQPLMTPGRELGRPLPAPARGSPSPRTSAGRVEYFDREPSRLAAAMLNPAPGHRRSNSQVIVLNRSSSQKLGHAAPRISDSLLVGTGGTTYAAGHRDSRVIEISPRGSRISQGSAGIVEIETAGGRRSRRQSNVQAICTDGDPRSSGAWRPVREKYVVVDSRGNKAEYYR